jgi:hypothetical protein
MPNTTNYSFPTPADTDLVKNGADAIRDLGDAVDTAMNTALGTKKAGMVLLNTTSFSAVASQSVNDVFSATYENYKIVMDLAGSTNYAFTMRLRVAGADNTTTNYHLQFGLDNGAAVSAGRSSSQTSWTLDGAATNDRMQYVMEISNPFLGTFTGALSNGNLLYSNGAGIKHIATAHAFGATTSFTGYTLIASAGNITGKVSTYGYNQ